MEKKGADGGRELKRMEGNGMHGNAWRAGRGGREYKGMRGGGVNGKGMD